jgi:hypothetical protein
MAMIGFGCHPQEFIMFTSWALLVLASCIFYQLFAKFALTLAAAR